MTRILSATSADNLDEHVRIIRPDGDITWVWIRTFPISSSGHQLNRTCGLAQDITEWKRAQLEAKESQEKRKGIAGALAIANGTHADRLYSARCRLQYHLLEPSATKIFGYSVDEAIGKHPRDLIIHPSRIDYVTNVIFQRLREGDMTCNGEADNITKDGRTIRCSWLNTPLQSPDGSFNGTMSMVQDITEKAREEEQLRASEANYRELFDALTDCIFRARYSDRRNFAHQPTRRRFVRIFSRGNDQVKRRRCQCWRATFHAVGRRRKNSQGSRRGPQIFEWLSRSRDGKLIWTEVHLARVNLVGVDRILAIVRNIDKRKREQVQIAESEKDQKSDDCQCAKCRHCFRQRLNCERVERKELSYSLVTPPRRRWEQRFHR